MTEDGAVAIDKVRRELESGVFDPNHIDVSLSDDEMLSVYAETRHRWVVDYQRLILYARLNEKVDSKELAKQQREQASKLIIQIYEIDKDIASLKSRI